MRVTPDVVERVEDLAAEGCSQREIARRLRLARATVQNVLAGRYAGLLDKREEPSLALFDPEAGPPQRCPGCGGRVYLPCYLCLVRRLSLQAPSITRRRAS